MHRLLFLASVVAAGCGGKSFGSLCDQIPPPAACMQACDPQPGAPNTCPSGYHCNPDGTCDAQCTASGGQCGDGYSCTADGYCHDDTTGSGSDVDANCPAVHLQTMQTTPSIELVLDRSGSMTSNKIGNQTRYQVLHDALFAPGTGALIQSQGAAYFGEELFAGDQTPCTDGPPGSLNVAGYSAPRLLNNATALETLTTNKPPNNGSTPTSAAIDTATADFAANPPPAGSPPVILLATDGDPNSCGNGADNGRSVASTQAAYAAGIRTFVIGIAGLNSGFLQQVANAGVGHQTGQPDAPYYVTNDPASLVAAFNTIINGVLSCDLQLSSKVDDPAGGVVTINGNTLTYGTDWTLDPNGMVIHVLGAACNTLKNTPNATVDAAFPCGSVIF